MATTLLVFNPGNTESPSTNNAAFEVVNERPVLAFDGGTNEDAVFSATMPQAYATGTLDVLIWFFMAGNSGNIDWDVAFEAVSDGDTLDMDTGDSFAAAQSTDDTNVPGTTGQFDVVTVALTSAQADGVIAGDHIRVKVTRDATNDTNTDDAYLFKVEVREQ
jgi:hypothetical protein